MLSGALESRKDLCLLEYTHASCPPAGKATQAALLFSDLQQKEKIDTEEYQFLILGRIPVFVEVTFQVSVTHGPGKVGSSPRSPAGSLLVTGHSGKGPGASRLAGSLERGGH